MCVLFKQTIFCTFTKRFRGVMVITMSFDLINPSSILGGTFNPRGPMAKICSFYLHSPESIPGEDVIFL